MRAPGSSANIGPGFDVLGVAVSRYVWAADSPTGEACSGPCGPDHIARIAFEEAGGKGDIWFGFELEPGRGLGFSAAARAAGAVLAGLCDGADLETAKERAYPVVADIEGHGDNAAPSVYGGIHLIAGDHNHRLATQFPGRLLWWMPQLETETDASRLELPANVPRSDAVFNIGRLGLLVAALYEGDLTLLRRATEDRLHQPQRLAQCEVAQKAIQAALDSGAAAAWLSGSGPTVGIVTADDHVESVIAALPPVGRVLDLPVDEVGSIITDR
ncbi:MAG: homoserine kinase [Acidimicrobiales bacterium]